MPPFLIAGLGNPGRAYEGTFHNAGRDVAVSFAKKNKLVFRNKTDALIAAGDDFIIILPNAFMNNSGSVIKSFMNKKAIYPEKLIVIADDTYVEMGLIKIKPSGSSAGHNGLLSIEEELGTKEWMRIRIGIGPDPGGAYRSDYVLSKPRREVLQYYETGKELALAALEIILQEGLERAMTIFNAGRKS